MNEVRLSTEKYDALQHSIQTKAAKIDALEAEIAKLKSEHEAEIERLVKDGKVRVICNSSLSREDVHDLDLFLALCLTYYVRPLCQKHAFSVAVFLHGQLFKALEYPVFFRCYHFHECIKKPAYENRLLIDWIYLFVQETRDLE